LHPELAEPIIVKETVEMNALLLEHALDLSAYLTYENEMGKVQAMRILWLSKGKIAEALCCLGYINIHKY